jgi:hypothetical protein
MESQPFRKITGPDPFMKTVLAIISAIALLAIAGCIFALVECHRLDQLNRSDSVMVAKTLSEIDARLGDATNRLANLKDRLDFQENIFNNLPTFIQRMNEIKTAEADGKISHQQAQLMRDSLAGKVTMYIAPDGTLTTNRVSKVVVAVTNQP